MESPQTASFSRVVGPADTAAAWGEEFPEAASTPFLLGLAEVACHRAVADDLGDDEITVGISAEITHSAPSPPGARLTAEATAEEQNGRRLKFRVSVRDGEREVGRVRHERAIIGRGTLLERLKSS